jgi:hypothetical protein
MHAIAETVQAHSLLPQPTEIDVGSDNDAIARETLGFRQPVAVFVNDCLSVPSQIRS